MKEIFVMVQEGWSLAESFCVRCIVAAPYVVPYRYLTSSSPSYTISNILESGCRYDCFFGEQLQFCKSINDHELLTFRTQMIEVP